VGTAGAFQVLLKVEQFGVVAGFLARLGVDLIAVEKPIDEFGVDGWRPSRAIRRTPPEPGSSVSRRPFAIPATIWPNCESMSFFMASRWASVNFVSV
jgi:hypothetical protein